ncbi:MAG TPA: hypothetical protein DCR15_02340 [Arthrobacter bacterium]|nr:hypothetical protein [Arthrobacter sp.]
MSTAWGCAPSPIRSCTRPSKTASLACCCCCRWPFPPAGGAEYRRLNRRTWAWMVALALTGGSVPFALFFTGLKMTTAATGSLVNHFQFVLVAVFAVVFLKEAIRPAMWAGLAVLLLGTLFGTNLHALRWNQGAWLILASTVLFAIDFVIAKHLLRGLATLTVMTARMTIGTAMLFVFVIASGHLGQTAHLGLIQWRFVVITGLILLAFTVTTFTAIRHASVSAVLAIGAAAPIHHHCAPGTQHRTAQADFD